MQLGMERYSHRCDPPHTLQKNCILLFPDYLKADLRSPLIGRLPLPIRFLISRLHPNYHEPVELPSNCSTQSHSLFRITSAKATLKGIMTVICINYSLKTILDRKQSFILGRLQGKVTN